MLSRPRFWRILSWSILLTLILVLFRSMFSRGLLDTPDFFLLFPQITTGRGVEVYLSQWNPGNLGNSSSQPAVYLIFSLMTLLGLPPGVLLPVTLIGFLFTGAAALQLLLEPALSDPRFALLGAVFFVLSPVVFVEIFNASSAIPFDFLSPMVILLSYRVSQRPSAKRILSLSAVLGLIFAFVPFGPAYVLPALLLFPFCTALVRKSVRDGLRILGSLIVALLLGLALNAPYYIGNLGYFSSNALQPKFATAATVVPVAYGFSSPLQFLSLLGAGLYVRYASFYSPFSEALLVGFTGFAIVGLFFIQRPANRELGFYSAILFVTCGAWIVLTAYDLTLPLYKTFGLLTAVNYPEVFYNYNAICLAVLATLAIDNVTLQRRVAAGRTILRDEGDIDALSVRPRRLRYRCQFFARGLLAVAIPSFVVLLLVVPAGFYLETGNFEVFDAPGAYGFPPEWGPTVPSAYPAMYNFLDTHGGVLDSRALILPFPGFDGGLEFGPYSINTLDLPEYNGGTSAAELFVGPRSSEYATGVLNYLIDNRTDQIGVLLGEAAVRYVLVDLQANFTGPPQWEDGSLVGSPDLFLRLLYSQIDLEPVFSSTLFVAFLNLDYEPYLSGFPGVDLLHEGESEVPLNLTTEEWPMKTTNWSSPLPASRIAQVGMMADGYQVFGINDSGVMNITFSPSSGTVTGASERLDNQGFYILSSSVPVTDQAYSVLFGQVYTGPANHLAGYVSVVGYDSHGSVLWSIPSYTVASSTQPQVVMPFLPDEANPRTAYVQMSIAFPTNFGSGVLASYSVTDLRLEVDLPPLPSEILASLPFRQLPLATPASRYALVPSFDISSAASESLNETGIPVRELCLNFCSGGQYTLSDQLFFAYASLNVSGGSWQIEPVLDALGGEVVSTNGSSEAGFEINPSPFDAVAIRLEGNGSVTISTGGNLLLHAVINSTSLQWVESATLAETSALSLIATMSGSVQVDSIWFGQLYSVNLQNGTVAGAGVSTTGESLTEYTGSIGPNTSFVTLAQGFSPLWSMQVGSVTLSSMLANGWENGFAVLPVAHGVVGSFTIQFTGQDSHTILVAVQGATAIVILASLVAISMPPVSRRLAHITDRALRLMRFDR